MAFRSIIRPLRVGQKAEKASPAPAIVFLVLLVGCDGFFVDPTLTGIAVVPPTPSILENSTLQMTAGGTYDDGSTKKITGPVTWTLSNSTVAKVSSSGLVTGIGPGTTSISASVGTVSGSTNILVTVANLSSIQVTPTSASISSGQTQQFQAMGLLQNGQQEDLTQAVTWNSSQPLVATIDATGLATAKTVNSVSTTTITATSGTVVSNSVLLGVNP